jgi:1,4-alpha-glucan branching enzyme
MPKKARSKKTQKKTEKKIEKKRITFKLEASEAKEAILAGDFNSWDLKKHTMKKDNKGRWTKIVTLAPGRYEYKFLVDGQWQNDPNNDQMVANSYGTLNNILTV